MLIDTTQNTKIVYLFVEKFEWLHTMDREQSVGHPKPGRLYRAIKNTDTNSYRVMYPINGAFQGTLIDQLDGAADVYISEIHEVTLDNILKFSISTEDLKEFERWLDTKNKDLVEYMEKFFKKQKSPTSKSINELPDEEFFRVILKTLGNRDPEMAAVLSTLDQLRAADPHAYLGMALFSHHLLNKQQQEETPIDSFWIRLDEQLGGGANLSSALEKLAQYGGKNRRLNYSEDDLMGAIRDLLLEAYRRDLHNLK